MCLLDTNIWLERLLDQEQSEVVADLLSQLDTKDICLTDFCLHSARHPHALHQRTTPRRFS